MKKSCEIKGGGPEVAVVGWQNFNSTGIGTKIHLNCCYLNFYHYQTTTAISGLPPLISFSCCLFCMGRTFFTV